MDGPEVPPIADDEILYRRVPATKYVNGRIAADYMLPHTVNDKDGMSFFRARLEPAESIVSKASNRSDVTGKRRATPGVFAIPVSSLKAHGLTVVPSPTEDHPSHCHVPELNSTLRDSSKVRLLSMVLAVELAENVVIPPEAIQGSMTPRPDTTPHSPETRWSQHWC